MCNDIASQDHFVIVYCPDEYKIKRMCNKAVDNSLAVLKLVHDWFLTSKTIKKPFTALYVDENILYFDEDSGIVVFL